MEQDLRDDLAAFMARVDYDTFGLLCAPEFHVCFCVAHRRNP